MVEKTFEEYKQDMRDYLIQIRKEQYGQTTAEDIPTTQRDIAGITAGLYDNFPKKPAPEDRIAICYAYLYMSDLPMSQEYYHHWHEQMKKYINLAEKSNPAFEQNLLFVMKHLSRSGGTAKENFTYGEKALSRMKPEHRKNPYITEITAKLARPYFDQLLQEAGDAKNFKDYSHQVKAFDKIVPVMLKLPSGSRYGASRKLLDQMRKVYYESEWGRVEFPRKASIISRRVFNSLPLEAKNAIRENSNKYR